MNPLLSHHLTQLALHAQDTLFAEAAAARLLRQVPSRHATPTPLRRLRYGLAATLHALAILLDHTVVPAPQVVRAMRVTL